MSPDIGNLFVGSMLGHVESQAGHHRCRPRGPTQSEVAKTYGVSKGWVSKLIACYRAEGEKRSNRDLVEAMDGDLPAFRDLWLATGVDVEHISWLDDCTRYALHVTAHPRVTGPIVIETFRRSLALHGIPAPR